jgi:hypothetical protein
MDSSPKPATSARSERTFSPRVWLGCDFFAWLRIMAKGRFAFTLPHLHIGVCTAAASFGHTVLKYAQQALYGARIRRTKIEKAPVFIVGHWRTGTTLLHELMILDPQHTFPNTYQCFDPNHFLLTEKHFTRWFNFLLPEKRPMDNMSVGWERPQEDEFALCLLGQPSPYLDIAFPNRPPLTPGALDLEGLTPGQRRDWKRTFYRFLQALTLKDPRRLVLKSPPHSCRIKTLLEMFPDARFVHIMRDPYTVYPSTVKLWKSLAVKQSCQTPNHRGIEEKVLSTFTHLYAKLEEGKRLVDPSRFHELKYEDLVRDPVGEMEHLYKRLELSGFGELQPRLEEYLARHANYETNKFDLTPEQREEVTRRWGDVIRRYGYDAPAMPHRERPDVAPHILPFPTRSEAVPAAHARAGAM